MKTIVLILILFAPTFAQRRLTVNLAVNRTARFERRFDYDQFAVSVTAGWKLSRRLSATFGLVQPAQNRLPSYRVGLAWRIF